MPPKSFYRIEVAPVVVLPLNRSQFFSYQSAKALAPGSVVRVPFGSREIDGVVYRSDKIAGRPPVWMKKVHKVTEEAFLNDTQRILAERVSDEYFAPLGKTLKHFLPKRTKLRRPKKDAALPASLEKFSTTAEEKKFLQAFKKMSGGEKAIYNPEFFAQSKRLLVMLAETVSQKHQQTLILVPEITLFPALRDELKKYFPATNIALLHSKLPGSLYFDAWERIRSGTAQVILATRQGLFAPFHNLGLIILTDEDSQSYKQWDMTPRYDARKIGPMLGQITQARYLISAPAPSVEAYSKTEANEYVKLSPIFRDMPIGEAVTLVNLKLERFQKNASPLSRPLQEAIRAALEQKKQILLYVERQGMSFFSVCENCKNIFRCPRCSRALANTTSGYFQCPACNYKTALFPGCPTCRHLSFRHIGFGTERIEKEVKKLFPGAHVFRADSTTLKSRHAGETLAEKGSNGEIDILIGTQMILNDPPLPMLSLVAIIDADSLLTFPDFRADERYFSLLYRMSGKTWCRKDGVIAQTFHPESTINQRLLSLSPRDLYRDILADRDAMRYPPTHRLLLIRCEDKRASVAKERFTEIKTTLEKFLEKSGGKLLPLTEEAKYQKRDRLYQYRLALMIPGGDILPPPLVSLLRGLSPFCRVDVDPLSLSS